MINFLGNDWNQRYLDGFFVVVRKVLTRALFCFFKHEKTVLSSLVLHLLHLESADSGSSTVRLFINSTTVYVKLHDGKSIDWTNRLYNRTIYNLTNKATWQFTTERLKSKILEYLGYAITSCLLSFNSWLLHSFMAHVWAVIRTSPSGAVVCYQGSLVCIHVTKNSDKLSFEVLDSNKWGYAIDL